MADTATTSPELGLDPGAGQPRAGGVGSRLARSRGGLVSGTVLLVVWEVAARVIDNQLFLAGPTQVWRAGVQLAQTGVLWTHVWTSFVEFALGFALASVVGVMIGAAMGLSETIRRYLEPLVSASYATPLIAVGPLLILWFGLGIASKVALVFLISVFPVIINTHAGLVTTDASLIEAVRAFGASRWQIFTKVRLPSSLPFIVAGERLAVARALVGVVVAELFGARAGIGYLIFISAQTFNTANLFVGVVILAVSGVLAMNLLQRLEYRLSPWRVRVEP